MQEKEASATNESKLCEAFYKARERYEQNILHEWACRGVVGRDKQRQVRREKVPLPGELSVFTCYVNILIEAIGVTYKTSF